MAAPLTINGRRYSHASGEFNLDGNVYTGIKSVTWKHSLKPGMVKGVSPVVLGETTGEYEAEGEVEMFVQDAMAFRAALAAKNPSYGLVLFDGLFHFSENDADPVMEVKLNKCRVQSEDNSSSTGPDGLTEKFGLYVRYIEKNGARLFDPGV